VPDSHSSQSECSPIAEQSTGPPGLEPSVAAPLVGPRLLVAELVFAFALAPPPPVTAVTPLVVAGASPVVPTVDEVEGAVVVVPAVGPPSLGASVA